MKRIINGISRTNLCVRKAFIDESRFGERSIGYCILKTMCLFPRMS